MKKTPDRILADLLVQINAAELQNRLFRLSNREIAVAMTYLSDRERRILFSAMPPEKNSLVLEEIRFQENVIVSRPFYLSVMKRVINILAGNSDDSFRKGYLRPL